MGLSIGAAKQACMRDGKDPSVMDLDPEKSLASQTGVGVVEDLGPPLKDDPEYAKVSSIGLQFLIYRISNFKNSLIV